MTPARFARARGEDGFSLLETVVAVAIFAILAGVAVQLLAAGNLVLRRTGPDGGAAGSLSVERFSAALREASQTAIAVSAPSGLAVPGFGDVKLVLYFKDDAGTAAYTAYAQDGRNVYELAYGAGVPGVARPVAAVAVAGVTRLDATTVSAADLAARYGLVAVSRDVPLAEGAAGAALPVQAGNHVVAVSAGNDAITRTLHLAAGVMPSGFTITGTPVVHAVVYRIDNPPQCVVVLGVCVGTRTTGTIYGRVSVSYNDGLTWRVWCPSIVIHPNVYVGPDGFFTDSAQDGGYDPRDPAETTSALVAKCRGLAPVFPQQGAKGGAPAIAPPPIVYETPSGLP